MERNLEIAEFIRTGVMHHRLRTELADAAVSVAERRVKAASAEQTPPAHRVHSLMQYTAKTVVKDTLREAVMRSRYLKKLLVDSTENREEWYNAATRHPAQTAMYRLRETFIRTYGFPVITPEAVQAIRQHLSGGPVLEVGAGNGYLAHRLQQAGVNVLPTDAHTLPNNPYQLGRQEYTAVLQTDAQEAIAEFPEMDLLWSWPSPEPTSGEALRRFAGTNLVYIGEQDDGCTGGELFRQVLEERFEPVEYVSLPNFPPVHDEVGIYRRRGNQKMR